jgi:hypothetical protein
MTNITATTEDVQRILALEDRLFEMALRVHLMSAHQPYLYECDAKDCAANRAALGDDVFMVKYGSVPSSSLNTNVTASPSGGHPHLPSQRSGD